MNNYKKYILLALVVLAIGFLMYWMSTKSTSNNPNPKTEKQLLPFGDKDSTIVIHQDTNFVKKTINPSGTYLLYQLLKTFDNTRSLQAIQTTHSQNLSSKLPMQNKNGMPNVYVSIIEDQDFFEDDLDYFIDFISQGNYAFIASECIDNELLKPFTQYNNIQIVSFYDTIVSVNFTHPDFKLSENITLRNTDLNYHGLPKFSNFTLFENSLMAFNCSPITTISGTSNTSCILAKMGKGMVVFHSIPGNFGNLNILTQNGKLHAEVLFSHFPECNFYWHQNYGKYSEYRGVPKPKVIKEPKQKSKSSPLQFILKQPPLFWAFILIILGVLFYVLIYIKRQQRIIPPIVSKENSSLQFVKVVSDLYFQQKQHHKLVAHIKNSFGVFVRERYFINININNDDLSERLSEKSGINKQKISKILNALSQKKSSISEQELIDLYKNITYFYENCS